MTKVRNLNGTGSERYKNPPSGYKSWLDFWEKKAEENAGECGHCGEKADLGAHVKKATGTDNSWYIVPLCAKCNKKPSEEAFDVYETLIPVVS